MNSAAIGARHPAYTSIVAGGANACVLHYIENNTQLRDGDLLLIDAGCELDGYASGHHAHLSRQWKIQRRAKGRVRDRARRAGRRDCRRPAEHTWDEPAQRRRCAYWRKASSTSSCATAAWMKCLKAKATKILHAPHRPLAGMDVHDVGEYKLGGNWRALQPGMVLTVEPGCYIRPADDVPLALWNIGIRIEDDIVITEQGNEVLTEAAPKTVTAIEELMGNS